MKNVYMLTILFVWYAAAIHVTMYVYKDLNL